MATTVIQKNVCLTKMEKEALDYLMERFKDSGSSIIKNAIMFYYYEIKKENENKCITN